MNQPDPVTVPDWDDDVPERDEAEPDDANVGHGILLDDEDDE